MKEDITRARILGNFKPRETAQPQVPSYWQARIPVEGAAKGLWASIVGGSGAYCEPRLDVIDPSVYTEFEVALRHPFLWGVVNIRGFCEETYDDVGGWLNAEDINTWVEKFAPHCTLEEMVKQAAVDEAPYTYCTVGMKTVEWGAEKLEVRDTRRTPFAGAEDVLAHVRLSPLDRHAERGDDYRDIVAITGEGEMFLTMLDTSNKVRPVAVRGEAIDDLERFLIDWYEMEEEP